MWAMGGYPSSVIKPKVTLWSPLIRTGNLFNMQIKNIVSIETQGWLLDISIGNTTRFKLAFSVPKTFYHEIHYYH